MNLVEKIERLLIGLLILLLIILPISGSVGDPSEQLEQIRSYSRAYEFDYVSWTVSALGRKLVQSSLKIDHYLPQSEKRKLVLDYLDLINQANRLQEQLTTLLADPNQGDQDVGELEIRTNLNQKSIERQTLTPYVEQVLQDQINTALVNLDMSQGGQLIPPVLYRSDPDSYALIVSPRDEIRQAANLMLVRDLSLDEILLLEESIEKNLDLSALVVGIGGVGLYPSMIIESSNLDWLIHVISHEWTHNYLTLRPLGANYGASPELTTINETIADLSADDIQRKTFELFYPEYLPPVPQEEPADPESKTEFAQATPPEELTEPQEGIFDFRAEMHLTRLEVDRLLAGGKINTAEQYMEARRQIFWENGYPIRKLNQAYFAFHGSYAAEPGGAADQRGADLGSLLRKLRSTAPSFRTFMKQVAWRWRLDQFQTLFDQMP